MEAEGPFRLNSEYHAPKPKKTWTAWLKLIAARLFFPPLLLWDALKFAVNKLLGESVSHMVLPAQHNGFEYVKINENIFKNNQVNVEKFNVITHDLAKLDTLQISPDNPPHPQSYIINFLGNGMCYEEIIEEMVEDVCQLNCTVIGFNFRGVKESTGKATSTNDLVTDGIAQVQRLLDTGVNPQNIILKGQSLGSGVATLVAKHFHDHGIKINIFNGRSFSTVTNVVVGKIRTWTNLNGHEEALIGKILGWLAKPFIRFGIAAVKWEIDAANAYLKIPDQNKEYMVVRSSKSERKIHGSNIVDDYVITHYASLHQGLKHDRKKQKNKIDKNIKLLRNTSTYTLVQQDLSKALNHLRDARQHLKERKMVAQISEGNAHNVSMSSLYDRFQMTSANEFFKRFVQKTQTSIHSELPNTICRP